MSFFRRHVSRLFPVVVLLGAAGLAFPTETVRSQGTVSTLQIVKLDTSAFPEVRVQILMLDSNGATATAPTSQNLSLSENSHAVDFTVEQMELGAEIGFLLDAGTGLYSTAAGGGTRLQEMKDSIQELTQDPLLLTGKDVFYVVAQEPRGPSTLVTPDSQATQIPTVLGQYNPDITYSPAYLLGGVNSMLDWFAKENSSGVGRGQAIVVFSGAMAVDQKFPLKAVADKAKVQGVAVYTVQVRNIPTQQDTLQSLADQTGGKFFYLGLEGPAGLSGLKARLMGLRNQFILTYRSPNAETGTRVVSIGSTYGQGEKPVLAQYTVDVQPPVAVILSPGDDQSVRSESYRPTDNPSATPDSGIVVTGSVSWPDGHPRNIKQAALLVNGNPGAILDSPKDNLTFVWKPTKENSTGPVTLQIQIEDELGLTGLSNQIVVRVGSGGSLLGCPAGSSSPLCNLSVEKLLPYAALLIALAAVALVVVFRKQVAGTAGNVAGAATEFIQEVGETLRFTSRPGSAKAVLVDMDGNTGTGRSSFDLFGTTSIGRSQKNADLVFQANQSDSPISRLHCTILEEDGSFFVRDDQSANGTYLNGLRMVPMDRYPLKAGDEIRLGNPEKGGVRLQFKSQVEGGHGTGMDVESTSRVSRD